MASNNIRLGDRRTAAAVTDWNGPFAFSETADQNRGKTNAGSRKIRLMQ